MICGKVMTDYMEHLPVYRQKASIDLNVINLKEIKEKMQMILLIILQQAMLAVRASLSTKLCRSMFTENFIRF